MSEALQHFTTIPINSEDFTDGSFLLRLRKLIFLNPTSNTASPNRTTINCQQQFPQQFLALAIVTKTTVLQFVSMFHLRLFQLIPSPHSFQHMNIFFLAVLLHVFLIDLIEQNLSCCSYLVSSEFLHSQCQGG